MANLCYIAITMDEHISSDGHLSHNGEQYLFTVVYKAWYMWIHVSSDKNLCTFVHGKEQQWACLLHNRTVFVNHCAVLLYTVLWVGWSKTKTTLYLP